jgi:putative CocE/NonD family hydrolase
MPPRIVFLALTFCGLVPGVGIAAPITPNPRSATSNAALETQMPSAAAALIPTYSKTDQPSDLTKLYRLQLAAGRDRDAETTMDRLAKIERIRHSGRAGALVPWRIYARARQFEASGLSASAALHRAFALLYGGLSDKQMAEVLPWFGADLSELRATAAKRVAACKAALLVDCPSAAELIVAEQAAATWAYLLPETDKLLRADADRRFVIDDRLLIPTPDGAEIAAMMVRPRVVGGHKLTALLNFTIYAKDDWSFADAVKMAAYGYTGVVAYTRGKGRSPGPVVPYVHDGADATTVIDWLARQRWSDGQVGMFSGSYNASTQWAAAKHHPRALKALATNASNAPGIDTPMQGNVFRSFMYPWPFYTTDIKGLDDVIYGDSARWAGLNRKWYASGRPYRDLDKIDGKPNPVFDTWLDHPSYDAFWQRLLPYRQEFARIDIPVFVETGYYDGGMVGALYYLEQHDRYRPMADHRLLVGPYTHTAMQTGVLASVDGYDLDKAARIDLQAVRLEWFDHVFHGAPLPDLLRDRINFEVMGADCWRHVSSLADMADAHMRLYLSGQRDNVGLLFAKAPGGMAAPDLRVDFADRTDVDYEASDTGLDTRNALVFSTPPLHKALEVDGLFEGHFTLITNKRDLDLSVSFYEKRADGKYLKLASYLGRASYMADRSHRALLQPGIPQTLIFESQTVTARLLAAGSRIIAIVAVPKTTDIQINYGTGRDVSDESIADAKMPLRIRFLQDSYLDIGVRR